MFTYIFKPINQVKMHDSLASGHWIIEAIKAFWIELAILWEALQLSKYMHRWTRHQFENHTASPFTATPIYQTIGLYAYIPTVRACTALRSDETHWTNTICKAATGRSNARRLVNLFLLSFLSNQKFMRSTIKIDIEINSRRTDCPTSKRTQHTKTKCKKSSENFTCKTVLRVCGASLHFVQDCVRVCPVEMLRQSFTVNCPSQSVSIFFVSPPD